MRKHLVALALSVPLLAGLAGCGQIQEAQQQGEQAGKKLDLASACLEAMKIANFVPSLTDPAKAKSDAQAKAEEIGALAQKTEDPALKQNLLDAQASVQKVASGQVTLTNSPEWMHSHLRTYEQITDRCSKIGQ